MGLLDKILKKNETPEQRVGGMEDYMTLVRVYFQAVIANHLGITNLAMLPDLRTYKQTFHIPTVNNRLGVGERASVIKTMKSLYKLDDNFFQEIDKSVKKNCKKIQDVQTYLVQFQGFTQEIMMLVGNLLKFKLRVPGMFKKLIYNMTAKTIDDIYEKNSFDDASVIKSIMAVRQYNNRLVFSKKWTTDFVYNIVILAKKEPRMAEENSTK